jgi:hypothetical protein
MGRGRDRAMGPRTLATRPDLPKWPDPLDQMRTNVRAGIVTTRPVPPIVHSGSTVDTQDFFEVTWNVGDLRPGEWSRDFRVTVVAGPNAPEQISVELIAHAMDRRGTRRSVELLKVSADAWTVDDFYSVSLCPGGRVVPT